MIKSVIQYLPTTTTTNPDQDSLHWWTIPIIEELTPILLKVFQKLWEETLADSFIPWDQHHPDTNTRQRHYKKKITSRILDEHRHKSPQQKFSDMNQTVKKSYTMINWDLVKGCKDDSIFTNQKLWLTILTKWRIKIIWPSQ